MAQKKRRGKILSTEIHSFLNLPTHERIAKGEIKIRNNVAVVDDPLRIDKLLKNGIIDEMQHLYGLQIITYWTIANRPFLRTASYEPRISGRSLSGMEYIELGRMGAEDKFYKVMEYLNERERQLISKICFDEMAAIQAGRSMGLPVNSITVYIRDAFDALGNALAAARDKGKQIIKDMQLGE